MVNGWRGGGGGSVLYLNPQLNDGRVQWLFIESNLWDN